MTDIQKFIFLAAMILIAVVAVVFVSLILRSLKKLATLESYEVAGYKVTAITKVVGKRKVVSFSSSVSKNNTVEKNYTYTSKNHAKEDVEGYFNYLEKNEGFSFNEALENDSKITKLSAYKLMGTAQIRVEAYYDLKGYTICIAVEDK
ncbi:MAG: hypothetical protein IJO83_06500 [Clostridia bacterium]|nr:hypothetical protein [Clostridia bacterium]